MIVTAKTLALDSTSSEADRLPEYRQDPNKNGIYSRTALQKSICRNGTVVVEGDITMRKTLIMGLAMAGIGLAGTSGASSAPANGAVIGDLATATDRATPVQWGHWRWGSRGYHWRWGSYGYGGHWRWGSRGW